MHVIWKVMDVCTAHSAALSGMSGVLQLKNKQKQKICFLFYIYALNAFIVSEQTNHANNKNMSMFKVKS